MNKKQKADIQTENGLSHSGALKKKWIAPLTLLILLFTGFCAQKQVYIPMNERAALERQRIEEMETGKADSANAAREGRDGQGGISEQDISGATGRPGDDGLKTAVPLKDIYFDFDSYALRSGDLAALKDLSAWLQANRRASLTVEGHCDERGSIEYNMALGQKRAEAVREHLLTLGLEKGRIRTISYGKEVPADSEHTEEAYAKNRRAHLKID